MKKPKTTEEKRAFVETLLATAFERVRRGEFGKSGLSSDSTDTTISDYIIQEIQSAGLEEGGPDNE